MKLVGNVHSKLEEGVGKRRSRGPSWQAAMVMVQGSMPGKVAKERELAGLLGALAAVYLPLEMRGWKKEARKVEGLGWSGVK